MSDDLGLKGADPGFLKGGGGVVRCTKIASAKPLRRGVQGPLMGP